jgi:hypothetical protein
VALIRRIEVRIVVEGGGKDGPFREGFKQFFSKFVPKEIEARTVEVSVIRGLNGEEACKKFAQQRKLFPDALILLLVDSEAPVPPNLGVWPFLIQRGGFDKPSWADESHAYLMVQCVETSIMADIEALRSKYGFKLKEGQVLKGDLENRDKTEVQRSLRAATGQLYEHSDAPNLIALVGPESMMKLSHGARLVEGLVAAISQFASTIRD